jgi:hypothetical protein
MIATFLSVELISFVSISQFGVEGEMVTSLLRRLIGPYGLLKNIFKGKSSIYDLLKPLAIPEMNYKWREFFSGVNLFFQLAIQFPKNLYKK